VHVIFYLKGVGKIDLAGADFLIQMIREIRAAGGSFHIVALFPPFARRACAASMLIHRTWRGPSACIQRRCTGGYFVLRHPVDMRRLQQARVPRM
jgi:hypothetical protein